MSLPDRNQVTLLQGRDLVDAVAKAQGWSRCRRPKDFYDIRFDPEGRYWWTGITTLSDQQYDPLSRGYGFGHLAMDLIVKFRLVVEPSGPHWLVWAFKKGRDQGFECASLQEAICRTVILNFLEDPKPDLAGHHP